MANDNSPITEALIERIVDAFYTRVRADALIGPIFERHVPDWNHHLPAMVAFWTKMILFKGDYHGRPMEAHLRISGLGEAHFDRWMQLWTATVAEVAPPDAREPFLTAAQGIARSMLAVLLRTDAPSVTDPAPPPEREEG